ncbi:hypothetical protein NEDG_00038 [Nematocida displodere]|uniref:Uncharacterized protein n=1 Tax=Nematocida displodere TaxID=1805483 RepID=A0A177EHV9_9MICR|nr:hypothetical protein NEDG_00038 [Nematocida displodere]
MDALARKECCLRILSILSALKDTFLEQGELETNMAEIHRLIALLRREQTSPAPAIESLPDAPVPTLVVNGTEIENSPSSGIRITKTEIAGLAEFLRSHTPSAIDRSNAFHSTAEYVAALSEERVCLGCFRRSSPYDLTIPLVLLQRGGKVLSYHTHCYQRLGHKDAM